MGAVVLQELEVLQEAGVLEVVVPPDHVPGRLGVAVVLEELAGEVVWEVARLVVEVEVGLELEQPVGVELGQVEEAVVQAVGVLVEGGLRLLLLLLLQGVPAVAALPSSWPGASASAGPRAVPWLSPCPRAVVS